MNKSDRLDELRLEVGMIADKMKKLDDFYSGIISTIGKQTSAYFSVAIYRCCDQFFSQLTRSGSISEGEIVNFGDGMLSICSIRGKLTLCEINGIKRAYAPFYDGHHLLGILLIECPANMYEVTDEDIIFLKEIIRFIEIKTRHYQN